MEFIVTSKNHLEKINRYEELIKLGQLTSSSLDYKNIRRKSENKISKLLDCEKTAVYFFDEKENHLEHISNRNGVLTEVFYDVDETTYVGSCAYHSAILHINKFDDQLKLQRSAEYFRNLNPSNILLIPLLSKGELLGVIECTNSRHGDFDAEDIHFAEAIAIQMTMSLENYKLFVKLQNQFIQVVEAMADAIGKKDTYTGGHTKRVRHFAECIGKEMDLAFEDMNNLKLAAVLHDIGKIGIEDKILKKSAPLTDDEFVVMREHPRLGYEILKHVESLKDVIDGMRYHHERPDGKGYPFGLKGDEIPMIAMIISVADTFDAMISTRPYRKGLPPMVAWKEILDHSGSQFEEKVVMAFDRYFKKSRMYKPEVASATEVKEKKVV